MPQPTAPRQQISPEVRESQRAAEVVFNAMEKHFCYLYSRWQDEKEYEDFDEYKTSMKKTLEPHTDAEFLSMTSRPFAMLVKVKGYTWKIFATSRQYGLSFVE